MTLTPRAAAYARKRGGHIYVWVDGDGFSHVATRQPELDNPTYWEHHHLDGVTVNIPREPELSWRIDRLRLPWSRLLVTSNVTSLPPISSTGTATW